MYKHRLADLHKPELWSTTKEQVIRCVTGSVNIVQIKRNSNEVKESYQ